MSTTNIPSPRFLTHQDQINIEGLIIWEAFQGLFFCIQCLLSFMACYVLGKKGVRGLAIRQFLAATIVFMFLSSAIVFAKNIFVIVAYVRSHSRGFDPPPQLVKWEILETILARVDYLLGDIIVLWRAWILCQRARSLRLLLALCLLVSIVSAIADTMLGVQNEGGLGRAVLPAGFLLTNLTATGVIAYKTWLFREDLKLSLSNSNKKDQVEKVLLLLVESGFFYSATWIIPLLSVTDLVDYGDIASACLQSLTFYGASIYPTGIIFLCALQKTNWESSQLHSQGVSQPIEFAACPTVSEISTGLPRTTVGAIGDSHV